MRYRTQQYFYDAPAHPYKIINICPNQVKYFNEAIDPRWGLGIIKNGEWDSPANCTPIHNSTHYRGLKQHFEEGLDWENTVYYRERIQNDRSQSVTNHRKKRLEYFEDLFHNIKKNGYRPNYESGHDAPEGGARQGRQRYLHALEPIVTIDRDGDIYLNEGFHRFAIAKFLGIDEIPVNVLARHKEWQDIREKVHNTSNPESKPGIKKYTSHPDMKDVVRDQEEYHAVERSAVGTG